MQDKKTFLDLEEFYSLLGDRAAIMFEYGFDRAVAQFKKASYPPEGSPSDFINLLKP